MLHRNWHFMYAASLVPLALAACSGDDNATGAGGSAGSAGTPDAAGGAGGALQGDASQEAKADAADASVVGDAEGGAAVAFVRLANLSPGVAALDICLRPHPLAADGGEAGASDAADSTAVDVAADVADASDASDSASDAGASGFVGPVLRSAGIPTGLAYTQVTSYVGVAPGAYDVRVVAPNAADCSTPLAGLPDSFAVIAVASGSYATFVAIGFTTPETVPAFQVKGYADDHTLTAGQAKLRFIHASPGTPNLDLGLGTGESFALLFGNVAYSMVGTSATVDANGYLEGPPVTSQTLVSRVTGDPTDALVIPGFTLAAGTVASTFAIGVVDSVTTPVKTLICQDLDTSKAPLSNCSVKP